MVKANVISLLWRIGLFGPASDLWQLIRHPIVWWRYHKDYWSYNRRYGSIIGGGRHLENPGRKVLVVGLHGFISAAKEESMYVKSLQARGYTPAVLSQRSSNVNKYYRLFGYDRFVYFDEALERIDPRPFQEEAERIIACTDSLRDFVKLQYRGVHIGRHVLSSIMRQLHRGKFSLQDPEAVRLLRTLLPEAMWAVIAAERIIDSVKPDLVLFNERGYTPFGEIFDVALGRGINTIQWLASHRDDSTIFKRYTLDTHSDHPQSLSDTSWKIVQAMEWTEQHERALFQEVRTLYETGAWYNFQRLQHGKKIKSREEVSCQLGLDPLKKTAVIFSHILWDATFFYGESLFDDYEDWLVETVKAACANPVVNWIVKMHPVNVWRMEADNFRGELAERILFREKIGPLPDYVKLLEPTTDINTFSIFEMADYCVTVRGTVGIEMACFGVPVFTAGTGRYDQRGFTNDSFSQSEYLDKISRIQEFPRLSPAQTELARRYAYGLLKLRPLRFSTFEPVYSTHKNTFYPLDGQILIHARSHADLVEARDLRQFAEWAIGSVNPDFLLSPSDDD